MLDIYPDRGLDSQRKNSLSFLRKETEPFQPPAAQGWKCCAPAGPRERNGMVQGSCAGRQGSDVAVGREQEVRAGTRWGALPRAAESRTTGVSQCPVCGLRNNWSQLRIQGYCALASLSPSLNPKFVQQ